ncbi:MAG: PDZ domain-containing protein [Candidatus Omnitrophica bacterium]|nr:PDZ domain-containing protein [Candidatus Omnitrophota bacterium]
MNKTSQPENDQQCIHFFEKVYQTFEENYFLAPNRQVYNDFLQKFRARIYPQLKGEGKSSDYVRWRASWYLVEALKSKDDRFSQFYPPKPAEKFQHEALGQRIDLGIEGKKVDAGFLVTRIEPRSDAYEKGLREEDIILRLDGKELKALSQEDIEKQLSPLVDAKVDLVYFAQETKVGQTIAVVSKEYFKQTVFLRPVAVPGVFCLEIPKFNRTTGDDLFRFLQLIAQYNPRGLVLDLRGNPGGPPLAAREISSFFLKGGEEFTHFQKRGAPKDILNVPSLPEEYKFKAPIAILVDKDSGSAAELFPGIMQFRKRAVVFGTNTAGQVLLKSMFPLDDGSMIALVTAPGYYPDGTRFSFNGITPDQTITDAPRDGLINVAAAYLILKASKGE